MRWWTLPALAAACALLYACDEAPRWWPPAYGDADGSVSRAVGQLRVLGRLPRPLGSQANAEARTRLLAWSLRALSRKCNAVGVTLTVTEERADGNGECSRLGDREFCYGNVTNVVATLATGPSAVVINAHFDSGPNSPGASDNGHAVVAAMEVLRRLCYAPLADEVLSSWPLSVIFLFSNGEESGLIGSHAFTHHHNSSDGIKPAFFINHDALGAVSGYPLAFRVSDVAALHDVYAQAAPFPSISPLPADIFASGLLGGNTDFVSFDAAGMVGFDQVFVGPTQQYHTPLDAAEYVSPAALSVAVNTTLALLRGMQRSCRNGALCDIAGNPLPVHEPAGVAFDLWHRAVIVVPRDAAAAIAVVAAVAATASVLPWRSAALWVDAASGVAALAAGLLCAALAAFTLSAAGLCGAWNTLGWKALLMYGPCFVAGYVLLWSFVLARGRPSAAAALRASALRWAAAATAAAAVGLRSALLGALLAASYAAAAALAERAGVPAGVCAAICQLVSATLLHPAGLLAEFCFVAAVRLDGKAEVLAAVVAALTLALIAGPFLTELLPNNSEHSVRRAALWRAAAALVLSVLAIAACIVQPFTAERPLRCVTMHCVDFTPALPTDAHSFASGTGPQPAESLLAVVPEAGVLRTRRMFSSLGMHLLSVDDGNAVAFTSTGTIYGGRVFSGQVTPHSNVARAILARGLTWNFTCDADGASVRVVVRAPGAAELSLRRHGGRPGAGTYHVFDEWDETAFAGTVPSRGDAAPRKVAVHYHAPEFSSVPAHALAQTLPGWIACDKDVLVVLPLPECNT
eukprot:TRINITY_DN9262_c0_g1_i1.p1 TRINITY_DN9262_c0_g1~~TRINITY_DN9262_c0_g1_i1.p1  ORF type:complete len:811 (-),score=178.29 TRINITY_DN9262_c0_g1_i1:90-2501(-)